MSLESIKSILMRRDGLSESDAQAQIDDFRIQFEDFLAEGADLQEIEDAFAFEFGLEPDYLMAEFIC